MMFRVNPATGGLAGYVVEPARTLARDPSEPKTCVGWGAETGVVKRHLLRRVDTRIRPATSCAIKLINVAAVLVEGNPSCLACAVRKDQDILSHGCEHP